MYYLGKRKYDNQSKNSLATFTQLKTGRPQIPCIAK
jgi:hypothetical protein